jgi:hypothetical protein
MQPAYMSLTSTSMIGYRAEVVDRVAIGGFRSAMVAVYERFAKGRQRDAHTDARDAVGRPPPGHPHGGDWCGHGGEPSTGQAIDDTLITTKVKASFAADPQVSALAITVETENGVVTLSGVVENEAERQRAIQLAQGMEGVTRVDANKLLVKR